MMTTDFRQQSDRCRQALDRFEQCVHQHRWQSVNRFASAYASALQTLLNDPQLSESPPRTECLFELQALSLRHRRIMRQLSQQMRRTKEDIAYLNQASRALGRGKAFLG